MSVDSPFDCELAPARQPASLLIYAAEEDGVFPRPFSPPPYQIHPLMTIAFGDVCLRKMPPRGMCRSRDRKFLSKRRGAAGCMLLVVARPRRLLLGLEVVEQDGALLGLLTPVLDDDARAVDDLAGVALAVDLACS